MSEFLQHIFEISLLMTLLFGAFLLVKRFLSFGWQRMALISIPLLSVVSIIVRELPAAETWSYHIGVIELQPVVIHSSKAVIEQDLTFLFGWIYWSGVIVLSAVVLFRICKLLVLIQRSERKQENGCTVASIDAHESGSFFRFILLSKNLEAQDRTIVFQHEKIHARKLHSLDRLFMEAVHCFSWFNPVIILMKRELIHIHEFEVDRIMYENYRVGYMECLLAQTLGTGSSSYLFTNQFVTKLTLIKRIKTMKQTSKTIKAAVIALPLIAGAFCIVSLSSAGETKVAAPEKKAIEKPADQPVSEEEAIPLSTTSDVTTAEKPVKEIVDEKKIEMVPEKMSYDKKTDELPMKYQDKEDNTPEFKGGNDALVSYMTKNLHYPKAAVKEKVTGTVYVSFVVKKSAKVSEVSIKRGVDSDLDAEAKRVITSMPDWIPAEKDGEKIDAEMVLPVSFKL